MPPSCMSAAGTYGSGVPIERSARKRIGVCAARERHVNCKARSGNLHDLGAFADALSRATSTNARNAGEICARLGKYRNNPGTLGA